MDGGDRGLALVRKLAYWLVSVCRHWGSLVTSGVLIGGLGVWQGTDHRVSPYVYWLVAVLGLISAFYRTWAVEHDAKNDEHTTISAQTRQFAEQDERYKETIEALRHAEQGLKEEVARLLALQFQPRFRFVAKPWALALKSATLWKYGMMGPRLT